MTIIYSLLIFFLVVLVHEFGHFIVAKINNIKVNEFSIGMGPLIAKKQGAETQYSLRGIPIGGYVALEGEEEDTGDPRAFQNSSPLSRIAVLFAGAFMNFVLAIILFSFFFGLTGQPTTEIEEIVEGSPAYESELQTGDKIIQIEDKKIEYWDDISNTINSVNKDKILIKVLRNGEEKEIFLSPIKEEGRYIIGIYPVYRNLENPLVKGSKYTFQVIVEVYQFLGTLITGNASLEYLSGPVGIVRTIGEFSKSGIVWVCFIGGIISANLGAINLVPFPALDGGTILITFIEMITRKEIPEKFKIVLNAVGLFLLLGLILYVTVFNDILNFPK